jgi:hypothetical protein
VAVSSSSVRRSQHSAVVADSERRDLVVVTSVDGSGHVRAAWPTSGFAVHKGPWLSVRLRCVRPSAGPGWGSVPGRGRLRRSGPPRPGADRPAGHGKADHCGDVILVRRIRGMRSSWSGEDDQLNGRMEVTAVVCSIPGLSVRCGIRVARPARTPVARTWRWVPAQLMVEFPTSVNGRARSHEHFIGSGGGQWDRRGVPCSPDGNCQLPSWGVGRPVVVWGWDRGAGREHSRARGPRQGDRAGPGYLGCRAVPDDPGQLGHERVDRDGGQGRRHHGDRHPDRHHPLHPGDGDVHGDRGGRSARPSGAGGPSPSAAWSMGPVR